jgi:hypothetical protein
MIISRKKHVHLGPVWNEGLQNRGIEKNAGMRWSEK